MDRRLLYSIIAVAFVGGLFSVVYAGPALPMITFAGNTHTTGNADIDGDLNVDGQITGPTTTNLQQQIDDIPSSLFACQGGGQICQVGVGACENTGINVCDSGMAQCSATAGAPSEEICDGLDNDCDGEPDDIPGVGDQCDTGQLGVCSNGIQACGDGELVCEPTAEPSEEVCDGLDNDCDGSVDDGNPEGGSACNTGLLGECAAGMLLCEGGGLVCDQIVLAEPEVCDGLDNDCDGSIDEEDPEGGSACNTGLQGECAAGTTTCDSAAGSLICQQDVEAMPEVCDGLDNDCDGSVDEGACLSAGDIVITEIMANPNAVSDSSGEWFELYNPTGSSIDLQGLVISDDGIDSHSISSSVIMSPGGRVILGINADSNTNGGISVDYQYIDMTLSNGDDELIISHPVIGEIDRVNWTSGFVDTGQTNELSENHLNSLDNDNLSNWCQAVSAFGNGDLGTPGSLNDCSL